MDTSELGKVSKEREGELAQKKSLEEVSLDRIDLDLDSEFTHTVSCT